MPGRRHSIALAVLFSACGGALWADVTSMVDATQSKLVKIYGAGGLRGLESYQSGFFITDDGLIMTAWSYVLDSDPIVATLHDGQRFEATLLAADPRLEVALLKIDVPFVDHFEIDQAVDLSIGQRVLAFSNLYGIATGDEPVSIQQGIVTGMSNLDARKGIYQSPYTGKVYVLDAMTNNAGAAGGALTDWHGRLAGMIGKEVRNRQTGIWLNYAIPISELRDSVRTLASGGPLPTAETTNSTDPPIDPWTLPLLGIQLVPDVLPNTPPYVEDVFIVTPADHRGFQRDDLIMFINDRLVRSQRDVVGELQQLPEHKEVTMVVLRGQELVTITVSPRP